MSFETERFSAPTTTRARRVHIFERERAVDLLAGRTVWSAGALPRGHGRADGLLQRLGWARDGGVATAPLDVDGSEPLRSAARRLESMLDEGATDTTSPGRAERALYAERAASAEADVAPSVRPEDVVVLHDPLTVALAQAIREQGGHALWHVRIAAAPRGAQPEEAWSFLHACISGVSAYVVSWSTGRRIAAIVPSSGVGFAKEIAGAGGPGSEELAWASLLSDVLDYDRLDCVGGTLHVRPVVPAR
jgi:trehalose synthase